MIVDCHTHLWKSPEEFSEGLRDELASVGYSDEIMDVSPERHAAATSGADCSIVFGLRAALSGFLTVNDTVAKYVRTDPEKLIGFAALDPTEPGVLEELERAVGQLGLRGIKLTPIYSGYHPWDERAWPIYERAEALELPILFHQGATFPRKAPLKFALPHQLEDIALRHPNLKIVVAHLGHPWEAETIVLIRKQPNVFSDISGLHGRPWQFYNSLRLAVEYGVVHKLLFGTDFPFFTFEDTVDGLHNIVEMSQKMGVPPLPTELPDEIIHRNTLKLLGLKG